MGWGAALVAVAGRAQGNVSSAKQGSRSRQHDERMYGRRYQTTVKDMRAAGLNPIMAAQQGPGGGVPGGAKATQESYTGDIQKVVSSALATKKLSAEIRLLTKQGDAADTAAKFGNYPIPIKELSKRILFLFDKFGGTGGVSSAKGFKYLESGNTRGSAKKLKKRKSNFRKNFGTFQKQIRGK